MRNPTAPTVAIELDKTRHMCMDFNAIAAVEEKIGRNLLKKGGFDDLGAKEMRVIIWACLATEDAALTIKQVGGMIHMGNLEHVTEKIGELFRGKPKANAEGDGSTDERPTGTVQKS